MKPVMQTISDPGKGNCMQAAIATLFDLRLEEVPHFIEHGDKWFDVFWEFLKSKDYEYEGMIYNQDYNLYIDPNGGKGKDRFSELREMEGVNGYFFASVCSVKFFDKGVTHAVIIDQDCNIVHDPYYPKGQVYPLSDKIGYNGIINVYMINKN